MKVENQQLWKSLDTEKTLLITTSRVLSANGKDRSLLIKEVASSGFPKDNPTGYVYTDDPDH